MPFELYNEDSYPSTLLSPGFSLIEDYAETMLSNVTQEIGGPVVDHLLSFARQLGETDLAVCNVDDLEDVNRGDTIGHGATMSVFKCYWKSRSKLVAVKRINLSIPLGKSMLDVHEEEYRASLKSLFLELRIMNHPWFKAHPNFVNLYGVCWDRISSDESISGHRPSMIVELADQTTPTLRDLIIRNGQGLADIRLTLDLLTDTAEGVMMLHATKIVHGDLKPENILLFPAPRRLVAKISDFGFCSPFVGSRDRIGGTHYWNAPECMYDAPLKIKPFAMTITRDLYSFALVMWFCLFKTMPYGREGSATESEVSQWKLHQDPNPQLKDSIVARSPGLVGLRTPTLADLKVDATPTEMLWFQIWKAMTELLKIQPNSRNISLGEMHHVLKVPNSRSDVFVPRPTEGLQAVDKSRVDISSGMAFTRASQVAGMNEALKNRPVSKYDAHTLMHLPLQLQKCLLQDWKDKWNVADQTNPENLDLLLVLACCYRTGFGGEKDSAKAKEFELQAARCGSSIGQAKCLTTGLLNGFDQSVTAEQQIAWLKAALGAIFIREVPNSDEKQKLEEKYQRIRFHNLLDAVPETSFRMSLFHSFIKAHLTEWEIPNGDFDGAAQDSFFRWAVDGELSSLSVAIDADPGLLQCRKAGFTLLHVAVDYCQEHIIRKLVQDYHLSPNIESDSSITPIEMAAMTGSIECLQLLLSLGAESIPLANQNLFTEVAMSGSRETPERSLATGNRYLLNSIISIVRNLHNDGERSGEPHAAVQDLLNGRYQISDSDIDQCGSPLELCISISNYHSVIALLGLGANPNSFNHMPPLHIAVSLREPVLVALLLVHGASPNLKAGNNSDQESPLHQADTNSVALYHSPPRSEVTDYTRYMSTDVAVMDTDSESAISERTKACIDILLFSGADIEGQDQNGDTPLMLRILEDDFDTAEYLLSKGANLHARDSNGLEVSEKVDSPEAFEWCVKHSAAHGTTSSCSHESLA